MHPGQGWLTVHYAKTFLMDTEAAFTLDTMHPITKERASLACDREAPQRISRAPWKPASRTPEVRNQSLHLIQPPGIPGLPRWRGTRLLMQEM